MTLGQAKQQALALLDEADPKPAQLERLVQLLDMGQREAALYAPIRRQKSYAAQDARALPADCRRPVYVELSGARWPYDPAAELPQGCTLTYEAYPAPLQGAADDAPLSLSEEAAGAAVLFAAAQMGGMEYDQRFFQSLYAQYQGKLANLALTQAQPGALVVSGYGV